MEWYELRKNIYRVDGSLRDIYVLKANREDWQTWISYVNTHYPVKWAAENYNGGEPSTSIDAAFIEHRWDNEQYVTSATILLGSTQVNCLFFVDYEIENDLDPRDIQSEEDHQRFLAYVVAISTTLGKEVIVTEENSEELVWIRVNGSTVQFERPSF